MINTKAALTILWGTLSCVVIFGTFILKNQVHELENELSKINKEIQTDAKNIQVLKAQWSHLNNPTRLRKLAAEHISVNNVKAEQIINYSALPFNYETGESQRYKARQNIAILAQNNKALKKMAKSDR